MMGVRSEDRGIRSHPSPLQRERETTFSHHHSIICNLPSLSLFGESRSGALKARSATSSTGVFIVFPLATVKDNPRHLWEKTYVRLFRMSFHYSLFTVHFAFRACADVSYVFFAPVRLCFEQELLPN
jgi:hypothetical protein